MDNLLKHKILVRDRQVPRYTSYPPAPHFQSGFEESDYIKWLTALPSESSLSLYLHVPFCNQMCYYCGCNTKISRQYDPIARYADLLVKEVVHIGNILQKKQKVEHIHFGGGSPTILSIDDFNDVMDRLKNSFSFSPDIEIAMEIDPRGVTEEKIKAYAKTGMNRVSLGVQDFDEKVLASVNREQPYHLTFDAVHLFRENGINKINFDLLYGLPYQTLETMRRTVEQALALNPDRISLFGYAHVPWVKKHMQLMPENELPDNSLRYDLFHTARQILLSNGYVAVGIDHFAKENDPLVQAQKDGTLHRNFQGYTVDDAGALIGLGASSIGKFPQGYAQNAVQMPQYRERIEAGKLPTYKSYTLTDEDRLRADVIEQLMCYFKVDLSVLCTKHHVSQHHFSAEMAQLNSYQDDGLITIENTSQITVRSDAPHIVRMVCQVFDAYNVSSQLTTTQRHSTAI